MDAFPDLLQSKLLMAIETVRAKITVEELATRIRGEMVPLGTIFSYFLVAPIAEEDLKQYLEDPIAALPPAICAVLPKISILLAPYLEKANGKHAESVCFERPPEARQAFAARIKRRDHAILAFATKEEEMAEYHYCF